MNTFLPFLSVLCCFLANNAFAYEQACHSVIMIRPVSFSHNDETAVNNPFQNEDLQLTNDEIQEQALIEFDAFVRRLRD